MTAALHRSFALKQLFYSETSILIYDLFFKLRAQLHIKKITTYLVTAIKYAVKILIDK